MSLARPLAAALAAVAVLAVLPSAASAQGAGPSHGVVMDGSPPPSPEVVKRLQELGAKNAKIFITYQSLDDPAAGEAGKISQFRATVEVLARAGLNTTVIYFGGEKAPNLPPADPQAWADRLGRLAAGLNGLGVTFTIWNEADGIPFWAPGPNAAVYTDLLRRGYTAVKANSSDAAVAFTPLTGGNWRFLQAAYDNGAKGFFDAVPVDLGTACNLASPGFFIRDPADPNLLSQTSFLSYREVRKTLLANGDAHIPLFNEFGWSVAQGANSCNQGLEAGKKPGGVTEAQQAQFLREAHHCMREDPYVQKAYWFELMDRGPDPFNPDHRFGLLDQNGNPRGPVFAAFQDVARGVDTIAGPCGDFVPPAISVLRPQPGEKYADKIDIQVVANDPSEVARVSLSFNGANEIRNFTGADVGNGRVVGLTPWFGSAQLPIGTHVLSFVALDGFGNQSRVDVPIERVPEAALPANFEAKFALGKKVSCKRGNRRSKTLKGRRPLCTFKGRVAKPAGGPSLGGKVLAQWQWYSPPKPKKKGVRKKAIKGKWKTLHKTRKPANKAFTFNQRMAKKGRWRLRVTYEATKPYKRIVAKDVTFRVR